MTTLLKVRITDRINGNPDFAPLGHIGYLAMEHGVQKSGWRGCPLGRGTTKDGAVRDLLRSANRESGTAYTVADLELDDRSSGPAAYETPDEEDGR